MSSVTINKLDNVSSPFSANDYLIVGQGDLGKKTTIQGLFDLTKDSSDNGARINYISYSLTQNLDELEQAQARSNLGIDESGHVVTSGVSSVNTKIGDVTIVLDNIPVSSSDDTTGTTYITNSINSDISTHNSDANAHENAIRYRITDIVPGLIDTAIGTHNNANDAHTIALAEFKRNTLDNAYASKDYVTSQLSEYAKKSYVNDSINAANRNNIAKIIGVSGTLTPSTTDRSVTIDSAFIGAVPITRRVNGQALSTDITIKTSDIGAVPTSRTVNGQPLTNNVNLSATDVKALSTENGGTVKGNTIFNRDVTIQGNLDLTSINSKMYGTSLPSTGTTGQLFFLLSS